MRELDSDESVKYRFEGLLIGSIPSTAIVIGDVFLDIFQMPETILTLCVGYVLLAILGNLYFSLRPLLDGR